MPVDHRRPTSVGPDLTSAPKRTAKGRPARGRAPGRPTGESSDLRQHLLDTAVLCFAREGIAGSSLRSIATESGVTPALLHYYFGNRDALVAAVVREKIMPVMQGLRGPLQAGGEELFSNPRALLRGFVRGVLTTAMAHPWLPQLWVREVLHEGGGLRPLLHGHGDMVPKIAQVMAERFAQAQRDGLLNPRLDPRLLVPSLIGQTMFMAASAPIWRRVFDADDVGVDALCNHVLALLEQGLELPDA